VVGLLAFLVLREQAAWTTVAGIVLCSLGILAINLANTGGRAFAQPRIALGSLLLFLAVLGDAQYTICRKILSSRVSPLANAALISILCFAMFLPLIISDLKKVQLRSIPVGSWLILVYYGTVVPSLSFVLWFSGVGKVRASIAGIFSSLLPIFTLVLSLLILHEQLVWVQLLGMGIIICGIILSVRSGKRHES
jgi:drug/metabolite transporter (DMT)-like permease